jgi:hypothetical protein
VLGVGTDTVRRDLDDGATAPQAEQLPADTEAPELPIGSYAPPTETAEEMIHREGRAVFAADLYVMISKAASFADSSMPYDDLTEETRVRDAIKMIEKARAGFDRGNQHTGGKVASDDHATLAALGITKDQSSKWQRLAQIYDQAL